MNASTAVENLAPPTQLTVVERAALALKAPTEVALADLAKASAEVVTITNAAGYAQCHAYRMALKRTRVEIEKTGKTARADAKAFADAVIAEERRLIAIIEPEELRLQKLQDDRDEAAAAAIAATAKAESETKAAIQRRIEWIRAQPLEAVGKKSGDIAALIATIAGLPMLVDGYGERLDEALELRAAVLVKLRDIMAAAGAHEAEAARIKAAREALEAEQNAAAEQRQRDDKERQDRIDGEDAARKYMNDWDDAHREAGQRVEDAERTRLRKIDDDARAAVIAEQERIAAEVRAEQERKDAEARAEQRRKDDAAAAERKRQRAALEKRADPWLTLESIILWSKDAENNGDAEFRRIATLSARQAIAARAELDKAAA